MIRFNVRKLSRRLSTSITFLFALSILAAVVAEFFVELAKEHDLYSAPTARLHLAITALRDVVSRLYFLVTAAFFAGLTVGMWVDPILKRRESMLVLQEAVSSNPIGEPGSLDYIVEGLQGFADITQIFQVVTKDTAKIGRTLSRYKWLFSLFQDFNRRRRVASSLAAKLSKFSIKTKEYVPRIADARERTYVNCLAVIEGTPIVTHSDLHSLLQFVAVLEQNIQSSAGAAEAMDQARVGVDYIRGFSREMNAAADLFSNTMDEIGVEVRAYSAACGLLLVTASEKAGRVSDVLSAQAEVSSLSSLHSPS